MKLIRWLLVVGKLKYKLKFKFKCTLYFLLLAFGFYLNLASQNTYKKVYAIYSIFLIQNIKLN
tara:strand:- start:56831 stop:57019 length:189 start_codon:yes stop_codon:yes gene_type:complete